MPTEPDDEGPIPAGLWLQEAAQRALDGFHESTAFQPTTGEVESIELVSVDGSAEPGIRMTWHQGGAQFDLLIPITRLAHEAGGLDAVPFYLRLAVDEPHEPIAGGERRWFSDLPTGPY